MTVAFPRTAPPDRPALWSLAFGNVVIGTGALAFVGMLDAVAADLAATPTAIGLVAGFYSLGICLSGPWIGAATSRLDRRAVLVASLVLFAIGHFAAAFAAGYASLLAIRVATSVAGASFTPQAAATASLLVPDDRRARAMAFVFLGWSIAAVLGMPAGALIASTLGWRTAMSCVGVLSLVGAALVWWRVPGGLFVAAVDRAAWRAIVRHPTLLRVVSVTAIQASGQFVLFSYLVIAYRDTLAATPWMLTWLLAVNGLAGFVGNIVAGRIAERHGPPIVVAAAIGSMAVAFALWIAVYAVGPGGVGIAIAVVAAILWGSGSFASNSMQQVRLVDLAPALASVSVALNTSAIFLGQFVGAAVGGHVLARPFTEPASAALPWVGLPVLLVAIVLSVAAQRRIERVRLQPPVHAA